MNAGAAGHVGPAVAGSWYPASREALRREVSRLLREAAAIGTPGGWAGETPAALIAPHAGYIYSGTVAAAGFRLLEARPVALVLLLGPSHYEAFDGATLPASAAYRTPLGDVPIDAGVVERLARRPGIRITDRPFGTEHSLEAELPFLQEVLAPGWRLVPVLVGAGSTRAGLDQVAAALGDLLGPDTLVVVSSDFTHFGPRFGYVPFHDDIPRRIRELDLGALERILAGDRRGFESYVRDTGATICGRDPIAVLLRLLPEACPAALVAYDTSGRMTSDWAHSVSYASVVFGPGGA
jgi:hypothetical protein